MATRFLLPYAFARTNQLLLEDEAGELTLWLHPASSSAGVSEVGRKFALHKVETQAADALIHRISAAYAQGESSAATVVSEVESDADLTR